MVDLSPKPVFREVQRPAKASWIGLVVYGAALLVWIAFLLQIILGRPFGTNPAPDWVICLIWLLIGVGLPILWFASELVVEVTRDCITLRYIPFVTRRIQFSDIENCEARSYHPLREYGGWGIRWAFGNRRAYSVRGDQGVELKLRDGQRVMIGSQRPAELAQAIDSLLT